MTQTRFTCTLTRADEPACQSYARSRSWTPKGLQPAAVLVMLSPRSTASSAPTSAGPTPRASASGERKALELAEESSQLPALW
jgi:hypothetical protein